MLLWEVPRWCEHMLSIISAYPRVDPKRAGTLSGHSITTMFYVRVPYKGTNQNKRGSLWHEQKHVALYVFM